MARQMTAIAAHWSRMFNRRRLTEELIAAFGWALAAGAATVFAHRLLGSLAVDVAIGAVAVGAIATTVWMRTRRRSLSPDGMARCVDRHLQLGDLLSTAVAVERGQAMGDPALARLVTERASREAEAIDVRPIGPVRWPWRATALAAAAVALFGVADWLGPLVRELVTPETAWARDVVEAPARGPEQPPEQAPALPEALREALARDAAALDELTEGLGVSEETARTLARAKANLNTASQKEAAGREALQALAGAEEDLRELRKQAREGKHLDRDKLRELSDDDLARALEKAVERGDHGTTSSLAQELQRRMREPGRDQGSLARALSGLRDPADGADEDASRSTTPPSDRALARLARSPQDEDDLSPRGLRSRLNRAGQQLAAGQQDAASAELERMLKRLGRRGESGDASDSELDRKLAEMLSRASAARYQQLSGMRGEGTDNPCRQAIANPEDKQAAERCERMMENLGLRQCASGSDDPMCQGASMGRMAMGSPMGQSGSRPGEMPGGMGQDGMNPGMQGSRGRPGMGSMPSGGAAQSITRAGGGQPGQPGAPSTAPGGGRGGDKSDRLSPDAPELGAEWLQSQWSDSPQGIVRIIERSAFGERSSVDYRNVHESYSAVAEQATEREEIPLTRRDYIQSYFEAIRPR